MNRVHLRQSWVVPVTLMVILSMTPVCYGASSCLDSYSDKICDLLTEEMVRSRVSDMPAEVKQRAQTSGFTMCSYSWPGPRTGSREIAGQVIEYSIKDTVAIKWLRVLKTDDPLGRFKNSYRAMTPEEKAKAMEALRKATDKKVQDGELSEDGAKIGDDLGSGLLSTLRFEVVEGVGTAAAWGGTGENSSLKVLDRDTEFEVVVDVYEDEARNREIAINVAKTIVAVCD
jgi:hypothetical protein